MLRLHEWTSREARADVYKYWSIVADSCLSEEGGDIWKAFSGNQSRAVLKRFLVLQHPFLQHAGTPIAVGMWTDPLVDNDIL